jgi:ATP:ADP antiporter, AAA family
MLDKIFSALKVRPDEYGRVVTMLALGFFLGAFITTYQITADSLFLSRQPEKLNEAFLISGLLGMLSTAFFAFMQGRLKFSFLSLTNAVLVSLLVSYFYYALHDEASSGIEEYLIFAMYCFTGTITALLLLTYWGLFARMFDFGQSKRIIGWIDSGQLTAAILASLLIPATEVFFPDPTDYLIFCGVSMIAAVLLIIFISIRFKLTGSTSKEISKEIRKETSFTRIFKDRYVLLLSVFITISMVTFMFTQFSFQEMVGVQYPNERELANFLAYFSLAVQIMALIMQTFVNERVISNYGLRISLFILPTVVSIFVIGALVSGILFGYDKGTAPQGFVFYFLLISLSRLFNAMLRDSLENPTYKLFFIPLDDRVRFNIQAKIEGVINETARFIAGVLIFVLPMIPFFETIHILAAVILLLIAYFIVGNKLHAGYKTKIRLKLENIDFGNINIEKGLARISKQFENVLLAGKKSAAVFAFKLLEKISPSSTPIWINNLIRNEDPQVQHFAQEKINYLKGLSVSDKYIIKAVPGPEHSSRKKLNDAEIKSLFISGGQVTKTRIQKLARSNSIEDRQYAAELLLQTAQNDNISLLIELLQDSNQSVRLTAIQTAGKKYNNEVIYALIENLAVSQYSNQAANALLLIGSESLQSLDSAFYRSGQTTQVMVKILQIMGRIGGAKAKEFLWNKIDFPDKIIATQVLVSLGECGFKAGISQISRIKFAIESDIGDIAWNLAALTEVNDEHLGKQIKLALKEDVHNDIEHMYTLLAMLYDSHSIELVKENIESGTTEGVTYAIELLDVFLSEQLKQKIIPVLDDATDAEKARKLELFYPRMKLDDKLVLKFLINRDFTQTNRWTKALIIRQIGYLKLREFTLDLIAQLFNSDLLIVEEAALALYNIDKSIYFENINRLNEFSQKNLNDLIANPEKSHRILKTDKIFFLKGINQFQDIPGLTLSYLADIMEEKYLEKGNTLVLDSNVNNNFYIVYSGVARYQYASNEFFYYNIGQFIGEMLPMPQTINSHNLKADPECLLLACDKEKYYELVSDNLQLAELMLKVTNY